MDWVVLEEQVVSHSILHPLFIHVISYCFQCCGLCQLFEAFVCRHERKWWARFGVNFTCFGVEYLFHCISQGNSMYILQSWGGAHAFRLPNLGNLLTRLYMGGPDYKHPHASTLRSKIHCVYSYCLTQFFTQALTDGKGLVSRNDPSQGVKINCTLHLLLGLQIQSLASHIHLQLESHQLVSPLELEALQPKLVPQTVQVSIVPKEL